MKYAIEVLLQEYKLIKKCLSDFEKTQYPEAKKRQEKKLKELSKALSLIENNKEYLSDLLISFQYWLSEEIIEDCAEDVELVAKKYIDEECEQH